MSEDIFPLHRTDDVPMVGRLKLLNDIWTRLTKVSPENVSVVGPKDFGKTLLLRELVKKAEQKGSPYSLVVYWECNYTPPQTDDEFVEKLCDLLCSRMAADRVTFREYQEVLQDKRTLHSLKEVMDYLDSENQAVLMIWDGFDKPLRQGKLTDNLFGNLRNFFYSKKHVVVTATRAKQTELALDKKVETSPFWNIFPQNPVRFPVFDEADVDALVKYATLSANKSGLTELRNWTGGHPFLLLSILNRLGNLATDEVTNVDVNKAASLVAPELPNYLGRLWRDCDTSTKNAYHLLSEKRIISQDEIGKEETNCLVDQGFASRDGLKIVLGCRLLAEHVCGDSPDTGTLSRLFGTWEMFQNNIRSVLELRIEHIKVVNSQLHKLVRQCLKEIPDYPDDLLTIMSRIQKVALDEIWKHEFAGNKIPENIVDNWKARHSTNNFIFKRTEKDDWSLPRDVPTQLTTLQLLTGSTLKGVSDAKYVSKETYALLSSIHQFRNLSEHVDGESIKVGVAVSAVMVCIELLSCLEKDLGTPTGCISSV